jgi:hypothetical protein
VKEQFRLEKLELFIPTAQEQSGFHLHQYTLKQNIDTGLASFHQTFSESQQETRNDSMKSSCTRDSQPRTQAEWTVPERNSNGGRIMSEQITA